jgi:hypothetical protein
MLLNIAITYSIGLAIGVTAGLSWAWERRFKAGREYGYRMGCEAAVDDEMIKRIRGSINA